MCICGCISLSMPQCVSVCIAMILNVSYVCHGLKRESRSSGLKKEQRAGIAPSYLGHKFKTEVK